MSDTTATFLAGMLCGAVGLALISVLYVEIKSWYWRRRMYRLVEAGINNGLRLSEAFADALERDG